MTQKCLGKKFFGKYFFPKEEEMISQIKILHKKELRVLLGSPSVVRIVKSGRLRWTGHTARYNRET
jgi:hypothetical protein